MKLVQTRCFVCRIAFTLAALVLVAPVIASLVGCGGGEPKGNLSKITGIVHVDGEPAEGVTLTLHPDDGSGSVATGISGAGGKFEVSTFEAGDGAPPGEYQVTFVWGDYDPLTRSQKGDRLNGRYASSKDTPVQWSVQAGSLNDIGTVELTSN
jgi:hypothetical protein